MIPQTSNFRRIDDLLLQLKGLVLVRELLRKRGASVEELDEHGAEIDRANTVGRRRAERLAKGSPPGRLRRLGG